MRRRWGALPLVVLALTLAAMAAVTVLENHADVSRRAQLRVGALNLALSDLTSAPFNADRKAGGPDAPARARARITADEDVLTRDLSTSRGVEGSPASVVAAGVEVTSVKAAVEQIYAISARPSGIGDASRIPGLQMQLSVHTNRLSTMLNAISRTDAGRAQRARLEAAIGTALALLALVAVFLIFYASSHRARTAAERLVHENQELLDASRIEACTDALTGLGNRRALTEDLAAASPRPSIAPARRTGWAATSSA